jgi:methylthioribose-1-phosphate isomerase
MKIKGKHYRTIWEKPGDNTTIRIIDQTLLPHKFEIVNLRTVDDFATAIKDMLVRGAPLIGATAGYGMYIAALNAPKNDYFSDFINISAKKLISTRPTAKNLEWAVNEMIGAIQSENTIDGKIGAALAKARKIADDDVEQCRKIGVYGMDIISEIFQKTGKRVNILTHCNAGWLATVDFGTATSPIYHAFESGIDLHVWVDETRPRNQGAKLTAFELGEQGVPHTVIVDNAGGHLMQHGLVDLVIVGSDRTTRTGDVANKIGTYLKALAAMDNNIPFYAALPSTTIDWEMEDGIKNIPIEERNPDEVRFIDGLNSGEIKNVLVPPEGSPVANFAFDVTPARLVTGLITERGICKADKNSIMELFPEKNEVK